MIMQLLNISRGKGKDEKKMSGEGSLGGEGGTGKSREEEGGEKRRDHKMENLALPLFSYFRCHGDVDGHTLPGRSCSK